MENNPDIKRYVGLEDNEQGRLVDADGYIARVELDGGRKRRAVVIGRRAGIASVFGSRASGRGYPIEGAVHPVVAPPRDIEEAIWVCAVLRRFLGIVAKIPGIKRYAQGVTLHTFIDLTPPEDLAWEHVARALVAADVGIAENRVVIDRGE